MVPLGREVGYSSIILAVVTGEGARSGCGALCETPARYQTTLCTCQTSCRCRFLSEHSKLDYANHYPRYLISDQNAKIYIIFHCTGHTLCCCSTELRLCGIESLEAFKTLCIQVLDLSFGRGCRPDLETLTLFMTKKL